MILFWVLRTDGLDERDEASLEVLLKEFAALVSVKTHELSVCHLNLIIVSRDLPDFYTRATIKLPSHSLRSGRRHRDQ